MELMRRFFSKTKLAETPRPGMKTPCLEWQACRDSKGYGRLSSRIGRMGKVEAAHRLMWELEHGPIPDDLHVLHKCDNPPCVAIEHLFLGTPADNAADRDAKGRQSAPPKFYGDKHWTHLHPEHLPRGDAHWSHLRPERMARGNTSGPRQHPERMPRGEAHGMAKLTEGNVRFIFQLHNQKWSGNRLAAEFGVSNVLIGQVLSRKIWKHVQVLQLVQPC